METQLQVYDKINDMHSITQLGTAIAASGFFGCERPEQGVIFALQCIAERKPPLEMAKTYHVIGAKLTKRADAMLADFRRGGGKWKWGDLKNPNIQTARVEWEGDSYDVEYTIEQAKQAGLVKDKETSAWHKTPAAMLRARCVSETLRAIAPELVTGVYAQEELSDIEERPEPRVVTPAQAQAVQAKVEKTVAATKPDDPFIDAEEVKAEPAPDGVDYSVCPIGQNAGKRWAELPRETLEAVIKTPRTLDFKHIAEVKRALENIPF